MGITMKKAKKKTHTGGIPIREYNRIHGWARRHMTKQGRCSKCGVEGRTHWSNKNQKYRPIKREWQELCPKCHMAHDKKKFGHLWHKPKYPGRPLKPDTYQQALRRLRTYDWFIEDEIDNYADVSILISMRDNVYIKQKYWPLWRELKDSGKIPELLEKMLKEYKERNTR